MPFATKSVFSSVERHKPLGESPKNGFISGCNLTLIVSSISSVSVLMTVYIVAVGVCNIDIFALLVADYLIRMKSDNQFL